MNRDVADILREHGIQPSAQRLAVAGYVLSTDEHPSAEEVLRRAKAQLPMISRATVYNTLNLFCKKGLVRQLVLAEGNVVFDCNVELHHHFIDVDTGTIHDVPWKAVRVSNMDRIPGYDVEEYMVVMRGKKRSVKSRARHG
ncbi:MAG: Peroxide stress regulator [Myxococcales bacterium]|nr:Peroxide stress regulator [Myxococcales bacterium]